MKSHSIHYLAKPKLSPMSYWVDQPTNSTAVAGKGFPYFFIEFDDFTFEFASLVELDKCIGVLSPKNLPDTSQETVARRTAPGSHWLNKLPGHVKSWRYRSRAVKYLEVAREAFKRELG